MTKQTGTIITIVAVVLTLCCSMTCCLSGIITAASGGGYVSELGIYVEPLFGIGPCCLGLLVWVVPLLLWLFLVRGKKEDTAPYETEDYLTEAIEDEPTHSEEDTAL